MLAKEADIGNNLSSAEREGDGVEDSRLGSSL